MQCRQFSGARNKLDLNDRVQVRIVRKRLKVSSKQLAKLVGKSGNSIAAVTKEASSRQRLSLPGSKIIPADLVGPTKGPQSAPEA
jgi:DNA-binding XRE family transcriptional regulator